MLLVDRRYWNALKAQPWAENVDRTFPQKVNDFLISKRFFLLAAKIYIGNQGCSAELLLGRLKMKEGLITDFMVNIMVYQEHIGQAMELPALKEVLIILDSTSDFFKSFGFELST